MKNYIFGVILIVPLLLFSQVDIASNGFNTTYEEYNFLTKIYGKDDQARMLEGYEFENYFELTAENFNFNYKLFKEKSSGNVKAIFIVVRRIKQKENKVKYLCIPFNNNELLEDFTYEASKIGLTMSMALEFLNQKLSLKLLDEKFNINSEYD